MTTRIALLIAGFVLLSSSASGQAVTRAEFDSLKALVKTNAESNSASINQLTAALRDQRESTNLQITSLREELRKDLEALRGDVNAITDIQFEDRTQLEQLAKRDKDGRSFIRLDTSHEPTRQEFRRAMTDSAPTYGTFVIKNLMGRDQEISVNGRQHRLIAGATLELQVQPGKVDTRLPGQAIVPYYVNFPNYRHEIEIRPQSRVEWVSTRPIIYADTTWPSYVVYQ